MKNISALLYGVVAGIWICYFAVEYRLNIRISEAKENKKLCEKSINSDQECVMVFELVPAKKEKSE